MLFKQIFSSKNKGFLHEKIKILLILKRNSAHAPTMKIDEDRYNGITVDYNSLPETKDEFLEEINQLIESFRFKNLLWIKIPIEKSEFIPLLTDIGFEFHHCDNKGLMLVKMLKPYSFVPTAQNYTVGVGGIVREGDQLLVIKDRFTNGFKLPGGHIDHQETIKEALKREVFEETGVEVEFESIINIGHFTKAQLEASNLYIVCTAKPISNEINIYDKSEIVEAKWINIETFLNSDETNIYNKSVVRAAIDNKELKLTNRAIKLKVTGSEVFF